MTDAEKRTVSVILWREDSSEISVLAVCATDQEAHTYLLAQGYVLQHDPVDASFPSWYERQDTALMPEMAIIRHVVWMGPPPDKLAVALQAMRDIADPMAWVKREHAELCEHEPDAVRKVAFSAFTSIGIARDTLRALGEEVA